MHHMYIHTTLTQSYIQLNDTVIESTAMYYNVFSGRKIVFKKRGVCQYTVIESLVVSFFYSQI